jgi:hypothetical protein
MGFVFPALWNARDIDQKTVFQNYMLSQPNRFNLVVGFETKRVSP